METGERTSFSGLVLNQMHKISSLNQECAQLRENPFAYCNFGAEKLKAALRIQLAAPDSGVAEQKIGRVNRAKLKLKDLEPEPELTHVDATIKVENDDELPDYYEDNRDPTTTNGVLLRMVELAEERARAMAGSSAMEDDSLMESSFNGEDCDPDRLTFDQECSTSNEPVEVKSEINEDEPMRSGDVTIKDAQSAYKVVRKFIEAKFDAPTVLRMCKDFDAVLANDT
ncbi:hypothetical protein Ddc_11360 [Ditylenchus destructor]|nr:hypothetical protein Ddc_11360 [Ditylenchus destructor]